MKITAAIITLNEESNIKDCLDTVNWADEILLIDSESTDNTVKIASNYTDKIVQSPGKSFSQKREIALNHSTNDWILFLDADERMSNDLQQEIVSLVPQTGVNGYRINRRNYYFGKWVKHSGIYPDKQLRLFNKNFSEVIHRNVHEGINTSGIVMDLNGSIKHYSITDLNQMLSKINTYSTLEAQDKFIAEKQISRIGVFTHAVSSFIRVYISRKGFLDGIEGLYVAFSYSIVNFLSHLKLLKLQGKL